MSGTHTAMVGGCGTSKESEWDTPRACLGALATQREGSGHR